MQSVINLNEARAKKQIRRTAFLPVPDPAGLEGMLSVYFGWKSGRTTGADLGMLAYCRFIVQNGYDACSPEEALSCLEAMREDEAVKWLEDTYYQFIRNAMDIVRILRSAKQLQS